MRCDEPQAVRRRGALGEIIGRAAVMASQRPAPVAGCRLSTTPAAIRRSGAARRWAYSTVIEESPYARMPSIGGRSSGTKLKPNRRMLALARSREYPLASVDEKSCHAQYSTGRIDINNRPPDLRWRVRVLKASIATSSGRVGEDGKRVNRVQLVRYVEFARNPGRHAQIAEDAVLFA